MTTIANSERNRPTHVAREIFATEGCSRARENGAPILFVSMDFHLDAKRHGLDSRKLETPLRNARFSIGDCLAAYCTVTSVPTGSSEKNLRAASSGNRMQPCDAG